VAAPAGVKILDAQGVLLANGAFMLGPCCDSPATDWLLDASTLTWAPTGAPNAGGTYQDEQGYELLPNNKVLTLDIWTNDPAGATNAEVYDPGSHLWSGAGDTPVSLPDPIACDLPNGTWEIGPAVVRGEGKVIAFGGYTCAVDPTAILDIGAGTWSIGPTIPSVCGQSATLPCDLADAPAALLPNGNILFAASSGYGDMPTLFFELARGTNTIARVANPLGESDQLGAYTYNFLVLPTGQILVTNFETPEIYTPTGTQVVNWEPRIGYVRANLQPGHTYKLRGHQLSGLSAGAYYGDDYQSATNFPLVRIVNNSSGHVFYAPTSAYSTLSIAPRVFSTLKFIVPAGTETGASTLYVVANGIASAGTAVNVR
jgi:hypothetical protein